MSNENKAYFVGGFKGVKKETGKPYWFLSFACAQEQEVDRFGGAVCNVYVKEDVWNEFKNKAKPWSYINACVMYVRGGYSLISYNL